MTSTPHAVRGGLARFLAVILASLLAACGSGGVSAPPPVTDPGRITILPADAILYSGLPTTFTISGGTGAYIVSSSNQAVIQASGPIPRDTLTVIPANVTVDTPVTLTVRDTGTAPLVTANLTVRPGTVANDITITPSATQGGTCAPAVCSGGDAVVAATLSQGGNPLPARGARLEVVSGDFRFITSPPGSVEFLETSTTVVSDQNGAIHARIRALAAAPNQTALVQVTDLGTSAFRRATFLIAQVTDTSPGFFVTPSALAFSGPNDQTCASTGHADVFVFGGSPPYAIGTLGTAFSVSLPVVLASGGSFSVSPAGACVDPGLPLVISDSAGRTTTLTVSNTFGSLTVPPLVVAPTEVTLGSCTAQATVSVAGGTGRFTVSAGSPAIYVGQNPSSGVISIGRNAGLPATSPLSVGVASGGSTATITVNLVGEALTTDCDPTLPKASPASVTLASCGPVDVTVSGGSPLPGTGPQYSAASDNSSVFVVPILPTVFRIQRAPGTASFSPPANIIFTDRVGKTRIVPVDATGSGPGSGTGQC